jgi:hypothetical protein
MSSSSGPRSITDSLVFSLNASDKKSYSGSGTTWLDRSGRGNHGTLVNAPTYNSANRGNFQFLNNNYISTPNNTALNTQTPSIEVWVKTNATTQNGFWFEKGDVNTQYSLFQEGSVIQWRIHIGAGYSNLSTTTATYMNTSSWYQVVATYSSGFRRLYINGVLVNSDAQSGIISTNSGGGRIGAYGGPSPSYYYNGSLAICKVYNKALTLQEIKQNFNATKSRFNLI